MLTIGIIRPPRLLRNSARFVLQRAFSSIKLINAQTHELAEFSSRPVPPYAILSHTWENEEVTYELMRSGRGRGSSAYKKIELCCKQALGDGLEYVWMDTCCIDKSSSSELSEAINSMFHWYRDAETCYAHFSDVNSLDFPRTAGNLWFKRGWTLQELLAPQEVIFFNAEWQELGSRNKYRSRISRACGINEEALWGEATSLKQFSIAQRMAWAADRKTTRPEDIAYSLLGIFDINMPLMYGEGPIKAFKRLQEEIMKESDDQSLFAWHGASSEMQNLTTSTFLPPIQKAHLSGLLASSPANFKRCSYLVPITNWTASEPFWKTNSGLRITAPIYYLEEWKSSRDFLLPLRCRHTRDSRYRFCVILRQLTADGDQFARRASQLYYFSDLLVEEAKVMPVYIKNEVNPPFLQRYLEIDNQISIELVLDQAEKSKFEVVDIWPPMDTLPRNNQEWKPSMPGREYSTSHDYTWSWHVVMQCHLLSDEATQVVFILLGYDASTDNCWIDIKWPHISTASSSDLYQLWTEWHYRGYCAVQDRYYSAESLYQEPEHLQSRYD